jgi:hypothetical protein
MELRTLPIDSLKPAPYNPRVTLEPGSPGYRRLERSLAEFTLVQPIVWNEQTGHVVSGHQRLKILHDKGANEIEVAVVDLPPDREKALNITLNNSQVGSDWDTKKLLDVLHELNTLPDFDATLTGFDANDINDLLMAPDPMGVPDEEGGQEKNVVEVTLEIPQDQWDTFRPQLDVLIADWNPVVHLKFPPESAGR